MKAVKHLISLVDANALLCHERVSKKKLAAVKKSIRENGLRKPLLVDYASFTVLDGHHRLHALRELGARLAPVFFVDYSHEAVTLKPRRKRIRVSKKRVVQNAERGILFPSKTTRHELAFSVPAIETSLNDLCGKCVKGKICVKDLF